MEKITASGARLLTKQYRSRIKNEEVLKAVDDVLDRIIARAKLGKNNVQLGFYSDDKFWYGGCKNILKKLKLVLVMVYL